MVTIEVKAQRKRTKQWKYKDKESQSPVVLFGCVCFYTVHWETLHFTWFLCSSGLLHSSHHLLQWKPRGKTGILNLNTCWPSEVKLKTVLNVSFYSLFDRESLFLVQTIAKKSDYSLLKWPTLRATIQTEALTASSSSTMGKKKDYIIFQKWSPEPRLAHVN